MRIERIDGAASHRRADVRELGLGLQGDKRPGAYAALARRAEEAGFDVVTVFNDLFFQPSLPAAARDRACDGTRAGRSVLRSTRSRRIRSRSPARSRRSTPRPAAAPSWVSPPVPGSTRSASTRRPRAHRDPSDMGDRRPAARALGRRVRGRPLPARPGRTLAYEPVRAARSAARRHVVAAPDGFCRRTARRAEARRLRQPRDGRPGRASVSAIVTTRHRRRRCHGRRRRRRMPRAHTRAASSRSTCPSSPAATRRVDLDPDRPPRRDPRRRARPLRLRGRAGPHRRARERLFAAGADRVEFGTPHGIDEARGVDLLAQQVPTGATRGQSACRPRRSARRRDARVDHAGDTSAIASSAMIAVALRNMTPRISGRS